MCAMSPRLLRPRASGVHPEANAWRTAVVANGGSVSASTMKNVSKFCADIDAAGIRDKFYRLNLFCGTGLNAALVPLYRGTSRTGTQYGNTTDTNNGPFVSGDYADNSGLTGTGNNGVGVGSSKYLSTGLTPATVGLSSGHLAAYIFDLNQTAPNQSGVVSIRANGITQRWWLEYRQANMIAEYSGSNFTGFANPSVAEDSHVMLSRTTTSSAKYFRNGTQVGSEFTTTVTTASSSIGWPVFATNIDGAFNGYAPFRMGGYSIGTGMTDAQAAAYSSAMTTFQQAMAR